jgi:hypothetical protein
MANQAPASAPAHPASAQHSTQHGAEQRAERRAGQRADPAHAQYVINLTPEQYESHLKRAGAEDLPPRTQIEMGGSGTVKVSFKDAAGGNVKVDSVEWSVTGPITVTADDKDPTSAKLNPTGFGPATITAAASTAKGPAQTSADVMVINKIGAPVAGTIEIKAEPATDEGWLAAQPLIQGSQIMPVPEPGPPVRHAQTVPPAQTMSQPSTQPQPKQPAKQ